MLRDMLIDYFDEVEDSVRALRFTPSRTADAQGKPRLAARTEYAEQSSLKLRTENFPKDLGISRS